VNEVLKKAQAMTGERYEEEEISNEPKLLAEISAKLPNGEVQRTDRPLTPLSETTFLTNAKGEPNLNKQIESEIASSKTIDVLMAFVRWTGVFPLLPKLKDHIDSGGKVRLITTTYMNHTEPRALEELKKIGVEIKISYDESQTRLHAKAWLFSRVRGMSTAFIGSSNMTSAAMVVGMEWNVRVSESINPDVIRKFEAVFESYWQSDQFRDYETAEFHEAINRAQNESNKLDL
jgi:HKD family nuclease